MVGILIKPRFAPAEKFDVGIGIDIIGALSVTIVADPTLVAIGAAAPTDERGFAAPSIVVVLVDAAVSGVVGSIESLGVALGKHDDVTIGEVGNGGVGGEADQDTFAGVASGFVREDGIEQITKITQGFSAWLLPVPPPAQSPGDAGSVSVCVPSSRTQPS